MLTQLAVDLAMIGPPDVPCETLHKEPEPVPEMVGAWAPPEPEPEVEVPVERPNKWA